ncbi:hypothetical protein ASPBRDRAFT_201665 [Aspergillus brasiliensis CBS 101740]|uniref:FAD-binding PCMH-type domain-containing protein n=1 Tax=Aspergillus brasiliensis (strain CBS 101740 / IMI 381727 / IBT 21946) TaxID=767769 RepID=A0A1L9U1W1_ASPBC|nr:hypothetical protein ASPBRDRAFT_201665 [Aspergillus brasiliensis CBS 101740]
MKFWSILGAGFICAVQAAVSSNGTTGAKLAQIKNLLKPQLSENARIVFPNSKEWVEVTHRAAAPRVHPGVLFLAVTSVHGWTDDISKIQGGIQIYMRGLNHISLDPNNDTVYAGSSIIQYEVVQALYPYGKQAGIHCLYKYVSILGPFLGSGHSVLQGAYGFADDNFVSAKVALHDGTVITASATKNQDLFWDLRSAGHNLGIVLEFEVRIFPRHAADVLDILGWCTT